MIDFIKVFTKDKDILEQNIKQNDDLETTYVLDYRTGQICYPCRSYQNTMEARITNRTGYIRNSLHKYHNDKKGLKPQNHSDFTYCNLCEAISMLEADFKINSAECGMTNLEFGLNITLSKSPKTIIDNHLLMYNFEEFNQYDTFHGKGTYKQYNSSDYYIKCYDKGLQYNLSKKLLRFEIKIMKSRMLNKLGIYNLSHCGNKEALKILFDLLMERFNDMIIIDAIPEALNINAKEQHIINMGKSSVYWKELKLSKSKTHYYDKRLEFINTLEKYNLFTIKQEIEMALIQKFQLLINH
ncbi:hypothetical protein [Chryseobacterium sp. YIM B08800]|uniref:hypothetical protein n=1 Tax=Chryseobacterium sp. YIM B08800 TaxID=2984136 RepID=UPI00223F885C|nr:hypothetical protein [Chryseobacterium sp. YIM B08800]